MKRLVDMTLYKWRYVLGYSALAVLFLLASVLASLYAPGGLTPAEMQALATTNDLAEGAWRIVNLPFHALQLASLTLFGVSIFTIKLPAIILSFIAIIAIFFLLRRWFAPNVTILSMLIMMVAGQFIFLSQNATPHILYVTFTALILLFVSLIIQTARFRLIWKIGLAASVALSMYTPYFLYINLILLLIGIIHPHTRYHLRRKTERSRWVIAGGVFVLLIAPLAYLCVTSPDMLQHLLSLQSLTFDIIDNLKRLVVSYFWIHPTVESGQIVPIMDFSSIALILLGAMTLLIQRHTARAYMLFTWLVVALPLLALNPSLTVIIIIPLFILLAIGTETLLREWYKLFPRNPYARGVGLLMLIALIGVVISSGIDRYINGYRHMPMAVREFSTDLTLVRHSLQQRPARTALVVDQSEQPLYQFLARFSRFDIAVVTHPDDTDIQNVLATRAGRSTIDTERYSLQGIVTNGRLTEADRLYLYKIVEN